MSCAIRSSSNARFTPTISSVGVSGRGSPPEAWGHRLDRDCYRSYQPAERRFQITRQILEVFADERVSTSHHTKSDFVARDAALMAQIARKNKIRVHLTITTLDERLARLMSRAHRVRPALGGYSEIDEAGFRSAFWRTR